MKRQLLFINGHLNTGGVERSLVDVLKHIDYSRYDVDLLLFEGEGEYRSEIPQDVHVYAYDITHIYGSLLQTLCTSIKMRSLFLFFYRLAIFFGKPLPVLRLFLRSCLKHYHAVIAYRTGLANAIATRCIKATKHISWWHHGEMNVFGKEKETLAEEYQLCDHIVSVSNACTRMLQREFPESSSKFITIPNMLCADEIIAKAKLYNPVLTDKFNIVTVGRLSSEKNMHLCLETAAKLKEQGVPFHWNIIGGGEQFDMLQSELQQHNLSNEVTLHGSLSNPYPWVANSHLYFHPSLVESQGLTILEAMALGVPTISVASDGPREFVESGMNGILINPAADEAVRSILQLYKNSELRSSIVQNAFATVKRFAPATVISQIEELLIA